MCYSVFDVAQIRVLPDIWATAILQLQLCKLDVLPADLTTIMFVSILESNYNLAGWLTGWLTYHITAGSCRSEGRELRSSARAASVRQRPECQSVHTGWHTQGAMIDWHNTQSLLPSLPPSPRAPRIIRDDTGGRKVIVKFSYFQLR